MMLPEHRETLLAHKKEQLKVKKPELDELQIEDFEMLIQQSHEDKFALSFELYDDGFFREIEGVVAHINSQRKLLHVKDIMGDTNFIRFDDTLELRRK
ncbi:YolD-like family protein [Bacillus gobiensis]|uniref:YolD-like family protein n=1 Tax=Bacillus gobiensis TaxID=1441095 RepID=UPI003D1EA9BB